MDAGVYLDPEVSLLSLRVPEELRLTRERGVGAKWNRVVVGAVRDYEEMTIVVT